MSNRQAELERLLKKEPADPFLRYGLAMEHKKAGRFAEALEWFARTLEADDTYCYAYYQQGQVHEALGDTDAAKAAYVRGIARARACNDAHAAGEMQAALDMLD